MIELVPYMLMLAWLVPGQPGGPDQIQIDRVAEVFASLGDCEKAAVVRLAAVHRDGVSHKCLPIPARDEFDRLFQELDAQGPGTPPEGKE